MGAGPQTPRYLPPESVPRIGGSDWFPPPRGRTGTPHDFRHREYPLAGIYSKPLWVAARPDWSRAP
jgi:hypothetical protein